MKPVDRDPSAVYDTLGRKQPRRGLGFMAYARGIPGFAARFDREVPAEFVRRGPKGGVIVACPCGQRPLVGPLLVVVCECERAFVFTGRATLVAGGVTPSGDGSES